MTDRQARSSSALGDEYAQLGVDVDAALAAVASVEVSLNCWQGDDVRGFEGIGGLADGGLAVTGGHPGAATTPGELRADLDRALGLLPGRHRVNLHAMYGEPEGGPVRRDRLDVGSFAAWIEWAVERRLPLDFNATCFAHPMASSGFTLSSHDPAVRAFWVEHVRRCRAIGAEMGRRLATTCIHDLWVPDGMKDACVDRSGFRLRLLESLDAIYAENYDPSVLLDALESKLFGIGSESFVVGSHELYLGYCQSRRLMPCLDLGHYHPTESVADKLSALLPFHDRLLVHVSRGIRWDSDHVPVLDDPLRELAAEVFRCGATARVTLALDFFDASVHRVAAWVVGGRAIRQALLLAALEPHAALRQMEAAGDYTGRLALLEHVRSLPWGVVWTELCAREGVPAGLEWLEAARAPRAAM